MKLLFEKSVPGRSAAAFPSCEVETYTLDPCLCGDAADSLPELSEVDVTRHFTELSLRAFGVDNGFYPLGSCTMKYNPKVNEMTAAFPGFTRLHPLQGEETAQGALELMYELSRQLAAITGMAGFSLQPAAGAHGEYTGLKMIRAWNLSRGETGRDVIVVPDSAHGTNPASSSLAGFTVRNIPSTPGGGVDLAALRAAMDDRVAGLMLTSPNTLGLFNPNIQEITGIVHEAGGLCYYDGANLNAVMGVVKPVDMGFDVMHINLHKTFATPHGGGGPGAGPVGCIEKLLPFLPSPIVAKEGETFVFRTPEKSIGKVLSFYGNFLVLVRAYTYILTLGREGIRDAAQKAVLNANYLKKLLPEMDYLPGRFCMHEFTCSLERLKAETGISALDVAKALIDEGIHPPTIYFPLIVHEAMMFEPTETETKETLDSAARSLHEILLRAKTPDGAESLRAAPLLSVIARPNDTLAARNPVLRWMADI